jgi:2-methylcitrate dehydratase PrpD
MRMGEPRTTVRAPTAARELATWASGLELADVPDRVVAYAKSQIMSNVAAARATLAHPLGARIVGAFGAPSQDDPARAAHVLAALSMGLDYDDALYAGHISHSTVNVPLAYSRSLELDGAGLLVAVLAANEVAARVTAASTLGRFRGQTASHAHLAGAVAGRLRAEHAAAETWVDALGLAFAFPTWSLRPAFLGSDAKLFTAAAPVRLALDACDAARVGLAGAPDILEHEDGFLAHFCDVPLPEALVAGLGTRWHTETLTFKLFPASTGVSSSVECAVALHCELNGAGIEEVVVHANLLTMRAHQVSQQYLHGPDSSVSALQYSLGYVVATALLTGRLTPADYADPAVCDPARWELAAKVRVEHDIELTRRMVLATAPIGEALRQAGERAPAWVVAAGGAAAGDTGHGLGSPSETFETADKSIGARIALRLTDGREIVHECLTPQGWAGPATRAAHPELTRTKLLGTGVAAEVADVIAGLEEVSAADLAHALEQAYSTVPGQVS